MDETLLLEINRFARDTGWLHSVAEAYANYGIALFGLLLLAGWWTARRSGAPRVMAAAVGLLLVSWRLGTLAAAAALAMAGARVYIAAHHPADVLAGLLLGGLVALALYGLARTALTRLVAVGRNTRLRPLLATTGFLPASLVIDDPAGPTG